jgi:Asp-tRNA(Asn)/Glu-tRNA(Gln) amidotransferase A subunit family amidase
MRAGAGWALAAVLALGGCKVGPDFTPPTAPVAERYTQAPGAAADPAASIDCGHTRAGLPIGLQIAGRRHDDLGVLRLARAWERMRPVPRAWPSPSSGAGAAIPAADTAR